MAVAVRSNGLHHAVSLGAIEVSSKGCSNHNYDSEDDSGRRRLRHTSSTDLFPRTSIYSKGDIREQYCLTDRQLNSIERPRRDRFFGCLSRRTAHRSQSFLGVCVGRRAPSDENLAAYAPFQKYTRVHQYKSDDPFDIDRGNSYFRRQPASILSTGKMSTEVTGISSVSSDNIGIQNRPNWQSNNMNANKCVNLTAQNLRKTYWLPPIEVLCQNVLLGNCIELSCIPLTNQNHNRNSFNCQNDYAILCASNITCPAYIIPHTGVGLTTVQPSTPRTKHVSFARSHTLTSFNDASIGFHSLDRLKATQSQERLIGGKKPSFVTEHGCEQRQQQQQQQQPSLLTDRGTSPCNIHPHHHQSHIAATGPHLYASHNAQVSHTHQQHHLPMHIHQFVPAYDASLLGKIQAGQQVPLGVGVLAYTGTNLQPPSPEVLIVEKKFRSAMKTQATQTDTRKEIHTLGSELSPRNVQKVKVVSQGAQTNGLQNKLKMAKDSLEIPSINAVKTHQSEQQPEHHSHAGFHTSCNGENTIEYYEKPAPPQSIYRRSSYPYVQERDPSSGCLQDQERFNYIPPKDFDYESQSLPRKMCCNQAVPPNEFVSNSLPRHYTESSSLFDDDPHLLPPPRQYCKDSNDEEDFEEDVEEKDWSPHMPQDPNRRKSMAAVMQHDIESESPFRRDDFRRQSMPVYVKTERLIDGYAPRSSFRSRDKFRGRLGKDESDEKEILIDFKPHMSPKPSPKLHIKHKKAQKAISDISKDQIKRNSKCNTTIQVFTNREMENNECAECDLLENNEEGIDEAIDVDDHLYENIPTICSCVISPENKRDQFRKRSVSLDDPDCAPAKEGVSSPPSPCREDIANASTYPSSDSLANDGTRDHSDGIWNESQATVLTADQRDTSDVTFFSSNQLLTPSSKRRNLLLQHQQRSSVDTDALDFEEQLNDLSPVYSNIPLTKSVKLGVQVDDSPSFQQPSPSIERKFNLEVPTKAVTPSITITSNKPKQIEINVPEISIDASPLQTRKISNIGMSQTAKRMEILNSKKRNIDNPSSSYKLNLTNTDISECSTNTDEYVTCTDTSKRTQGMKTPPTTTSSSSTTQVPVSTQSSQMDKSHGSSFESASSLHSSRGEMIAEEVLQHDEDHLEKIKMDFIPTQMTVPEILKKSPTHSISSTSSDSYKVHGTPGASAATFAESNKVTPIKTRSVSPLQREKPRPKCESISDDEHSEMRYSSSGYYDSPPHDDIEQVISKTRRYRQDEERKRRKTSMKLDIEKENMRALTSPIRKPYVSTVVSATSPDKLTDGTTNLAQIVETSPSKTKRIRPKIRRQLRKNCRDDIVSRRSKVTVTNYGNVPNVGNTEKLLDCSIKAPPATSPIKRKEETLSPVTGNVTAAVKSASEGAVESGTTRLKAKSIESLRSVSPGSDSVFYSEADGTTTDQHCLHCGKEMEGENAGLSIGARDSVESISYIDNEEHVPDQDIVRPPSDFADSPVITKSSQRLYKKMDRRFRPEERGRHYKSRQENIRAKSEERNRENSVESPNFLRPSGSSPCVLPDASFEQNQQVIYRGHYDVGRYTRLTDADVWAQLDHQSFDRQRERCASTESERNFHSKYQVILHRLVQRRCTLEMYHRQKNNEFELISSSSPNCSVRHKLEEILKLMLLVWARENYVLDRITSSRIGVDKTIVVKSDSGEFGFRIHGSKPVVVAAIEPDTPAESSGLEVGDIIISVNGIQVLDKHHTEVVKIAHDGCETLELQVARTIGVLMSEQHDPPSELIHSGYLWRQSGQAKGFPNSKKWVRRWFCLRSDNCLYYYKTEGSTQPVGAMIMAKHVVEQCPPDVGKSFAFKVDSGEGIPLFIAADSEEMSNHWIKVLRQAVAQDNPWLDNCARYLYKQPSCIVRPDCFGYLLKLGSRWCGWSRRYCVLKNACLYFYQDANSKTAFGMACLHGYKVATMSTNASGKKNSFEIIPPESKLRHYYFCTESEMDKKRWISALEYSIDRWIKSG